MFGVRSVKKRTSKYIISDTPTTLNDKVYPQLPFLVRSKKYKIKTRAQYNNPSGQLYGQSFAVSSLIRDERVVLNYNKAAEIRPQVERLIVEAIRNGDKHRRTMALANFWLREKNLVHKLFKVLAPRYENYNSAFTALHRLGHNYEVYNQTPAELIEQHLPYFKMGEAVLELRGNGLPPIERPQVNRSGLISNVLIDSARESYKR